MLPGQDSASYRRSGIPPRVLLFEINTHSRHQLQIARDGRTHRISNWFRVRIKNLQRRNDLFFKIRTPHLTEPPPASKSQSRENAKRASDRSSAKCSQFRTCYIGPPQKQELRQVF